MISQRILGLAAAAAVAALCAGGAQAAVVDLKFSDKPAEPVIFQANTGSTGWFDWQIDFSNQALGGDFDFHFQYDTDAAEPDHGLTLVSGRVGTYTDFAGWQPTLQFAPGNSLTLVLKRQEVFGCCNYQLAQAYFQIQDNDGDIPGTLPQAVDFATLDSVNYEFRIQRTGPQYRNVGGGATGTLGAAPLGDGDPPPGEPPTTAVPEPATWALMILGFGSAGTMLRRRRHAAA